MNQTTQSSESIYIEIAYATPDKQLILECYVEPGTSPRDAVINSAIDEYFPEINKESCDIGIFGKVIRKDHLLENGDRIEIYRPLIADPKEVRKKRAEQGLKMKRGGGKEDEQETPAS
jgi:uncharacterized protein